MIPCSSLKSYLQTPFPLHTPLQQSSGKLQEPPLSAHDKGSRVGESVAGPGAGAGGGVTTPALHTEDSRPPLGLLQLQSPLLRPSKKLAS